MRSSSAADPPGPVTSHLRMVSAPLAGARPQSFAISAADRDLPIASPISSRSCFSSGPVTGADPGLMWQWNLMRDPDSKPGPSDFSRTIGLRDTFAEEGASKNRDVFPRYPLSILHPFRFPPRDTLR